MKMEIDILVSKKSEGEDGKTLLDIYTGKFNIENNHKKKSHTLRGKSPEIFGKKAKMKIVFTRLDRLNLIVTIDKHPIDFCFEGVKPGFESPVLQGSEKEKVSLWQASINVN